MVIGGLKTEYDEMNRMRKLSGLSLLTEEYYYKEVLNEDDRYDWLYNNYKDNFIKHSKRLSPDLPDENRIEQIKFILYTLIESDPTSKVINNKIQKTGKYSQWTIKKYLESSNSTRFFEDLYKITNDLKIYDKIKHKLPEEKRDINKIKDPLELYNIVKPYAAQDLRLKSEKKGDIITLYNDNDYHILIPKTKEAACSYGQETRWCTASPGLDYFEQYTQDGPLYIIIHKTHDEHESGDRYQFHFESNQFMDVNDKPISLNPYFQTNPRIKEVFKNLFVKEKNIKNLVDIGEYKTAFELSKGDLSKFDMPSTLKLYKEKLIKDKRMNERWKKTDEQFIGGYLYYITDDWCDDGLNNLFHEDYHEFAKKLLCGDAFDFFDQFYDNDININNNWDDINKENLKKIQELSVGLTTDEDIKITKSNIKKISTDIREDNSLYDLVNDNEDWGEIKTAIEYSVQEAQQSAIENAYWKKYTDLIVRELGPYEYKNNKLYFKINKYDEYVKSFQEIYPEEVIYEWSIMDIIKEVLGNNGDLIVPREEYYGSWEDKFFNQILSDKLLEVE